jgi:hypothetical protein
MLALAATAQAQRLFVGLETAGLVTRSTLLAGFPNVTYTDRFTFEVSGAAATPEGDLYLCNGASTTRLYLTTLTGPPVQLATISVDIHAMAFGRGTLWGYSNFASPKGIYEIDPGTGTATLVHDVHTGTSFRFFGLGYNPVDDLLYGYTEYGVSGLYSIDIDSGVMTPIAGPIPASNSQGRGLAIGNNTVYLTATRGDDQIPSFAYDLAQGPGGTWVGFTNAYPDHHSTGGAAWIPVPPTGLHEDSRAPGGRVVLLQNAPNPFNPATTIPFFLPDARQVDLAIHGVDGRRIMTLIDHRPMPGGHHAVSWDGLDEAGRPVASSVYFYRLEAGEFAESKRMVLAK